MRKDAPIWVVCIDLYTIKSKDMDKFKLNKWTNNLRMVSNDKDEPEELENTFPTKNWGPDTIVNL